MEWKWDERPSGWRGEVGTAEGREQRSSSRRESWMERERERRFSLYHTIGHGVVELARPMMGKERFGGRCGVISIPQPRHISRP